MIPRREALTQLARLMGEEELVSRFGQAQAADPDAETLAGLVAGHVDDIARGLVAEAAASDDVLDRESGMEYIDDRLRTLSDLMEAEQAVAIRSAAVLLVEDW